MVLNIKWIASYLDCGTVLSTKRNIAFSDGSWILFLMIHMNWATVMSDGTKYFLLSISTIWDPETFSTMTCKAQGWSSGFSGLVWTDSSVNRLLVQAYNIEQRGGTKCFLDRTQMRGRTGSAPKKLILQLHQNLHLYTQWLKNSYAWGWQSWGKKMQHAQKKPVTGKYIAYFNSLYTDDMKLLHCGQCYSCVIHTRTIMSCCA